MKFLNRVTGKHAEDLATNALREKGYAIIERNFSNRFGEIDIIAKDKETLVFVEVKAKIGENFGHPEEMINKKKLSKIRHMADIYLCRGEASLARPLCRIDVIAIVLNPDSSLSRLSHYENVY
jgi:putative endonuclease